MSPTIAIASLGLLLSLLAYMRYKNSQPSETPKSVQPRNTFSYDDVWNVNPSDTSRDRASRPNRSNVMHARSYFEDHNV